jgi:hypothetical protein
MSCKVTLTFLNNFKWKEDSIMLFDITYQERDDNQHKLKKSCYFIGSCNGVGKVEEQL